MYHRTNFLSFVILLSFTIISCNSDYSVSEELVGEWSYSRTPIYTFESLLDDDFTGVIFLYEDKSGEWKSKSVDTLSFALEWKLQSDEQKIKIIKTPENQMEIEVSSITYIIEREGENNYRWTHQPEADKPEWVEKVILTRK